MTVPVLRVVLLSIVALWGSRSMAAETAGRVLSLAQGEVVLDDASSFLAAADVNIDAGRRSIVALDGPITPARRAALEALGIELLDYLPPNAYLASVSAGQIAALRGLGFVEWAGAWRDEWKLAPGIGDRPYYAADRLEIAERGDVVVDVTLFEDAQWEQASVQISSIDFVSVLRVDELAGNVMLTVVIPRDSVAQLAAIADVQFVEETPDVQLRNSTTRWIVQSNQTNVTPVYDNGIHGEGQIVGVMDGRLDINHCSFRDTAPIGPAHRKIEAYNTTTGADSHGTHVSGTAVGDDGSSTSNRGIAYGGKLVFNTIPSFTETAMYNALRTHHNQGARVHTNSWGDDGTTSYNTLCRGIDSFSYDFEDSLTLFAVTNTSTLKNPENAKNLLAVGASQDTPNQSNHCSGGAGPTSDGRRKPEIYAPGCATQSSSAGTTCSTISFTGTSMASPAVAGVGLLVRQYYEDGYYPFGVADPGSAIIPSAALVKATLLNGSIDMTGVSGYPSNSEGWGRVRVDGALHFPGDAEEMVAVDVRNAEGLSTGQFFEQTLQVTGNAPLRVTLVWTEPPASAGAGQAAVNNLDLQVLTPGGATYLGNVFSGGASAPGGTADPRNNVEQVHLLTPEVGTYVVRIVATGVSVGTQGYAMLATGNVTPQLPALTISLPAGAPAIVPPGLPTDVAVEITPFEENVVPGSELLYYRTDGGAFAAIPLTPAGGTSYTATLPAADCAAAPEFYFSATGDGGTTVTLPFNAPVGVLSAVVGTESVPFEDEMETNTGWTVGAPDDDATTGIWVRGDPIGTAAQPEDDHTPAPGVNCWFTGQGTAGGSVGQADVDNGKTTLTSPLIDLSATVDPVISYYRWYSNNQGGAPNADIFEVEISDGGAWVDVETVGPSGEGTGGGWVYHEFRVADLVSIAGSVQLRFIASDEATGSIVEAAIDDLRVSDFSCTDPPGCPEDLDGNGTVELADLTILLANYGTLSGADPEDGDLDGDGDVDLADLSGLLAAFGTTCG